MTSISQEARPTHGRAATLRNSVMTALAASSGMTCDELSDALGESPFGVRPRLTELKEMGRIEDSGLRRVLNSGKRGTVWRVAPRRRRIREDLP